MNDEDVQNLDFDKFYVANASTSYQERTGFKGEGGPKGLGDPADRSLSQHEREELIPQRVFDTVKKFHCKEVR